MVRLLRATDLGHRRGARLDERLHGAKLGVRVDEGVVDGFVDETGGDGDAHVVAVVVRRLAGWKRSSGMPPITRDDENLAGLDVDGETSRAFKIWILFKDVRRVDVFDGGSISRERRVHVRAIRGRKQRESLPSLNLKRRRVYATRVAM